MTRLSRQRGRAEIESWFASALAAVDPEQAVRRSLACDDQTIRACGASVPLRGRLLIAAVGKAAVPMTRGALTACGGEAAGDAVIITKDGHAGAAPERAAVFEASHPLPDDRGVAATRHLLARLSELEADDVALALISGGGSALLESPRAPLTLDDIARTTDLLLRAGAPIQDLNSVRIALSEVKGGGLRRATRTGSMVTLILSDVLGNDLSMIASGPTVAPTTTAARALELLAAYGVEEEAPGVVLDLLRQREEQGDVWSYINDVTCIVADNNTAVDAFATAAREQGVRTEVVWREMTGEARGLAREWVDLCLQADPASDLLVGGGEATVTVRGNGVGGRNTEFVLAAVLELERRGDASWLIASLATDGEDAMTGAAGAIAGAESCERGRAVGIDPATALDGNDSFTFFDRTGDIVTTGPTGTNVNDIYVALRVSDAQATG